jgi:hypothetical protein
MAQTPPPGHLAAEGATRPDGGAQSHAGATRVDPAAFPGEGAGARFEGGSAGHAGATRADPAAFRGDGGEVRPGARGDGHAGATRVDPAIFRQQQNRDEQHRDDLVHRDGSARRDDQGRGAQPAGTRQDAGGPAATGGDQPGALPRRHATPSSERSASMAAPAQAPAGGLGPQPGTAPAGPPARSHLAPPVIPGAGGSERPPLVPAPAIRPGVPSEPGRPAPGTSAPGAAAPGASAPGASAPGTSAPGTSAPGTSAPGAAAPGMSAPGAAAPGMSAPSAAAPGMSASGGPTAGMSTPGGPTAGRNAPSAPGASAPPPVHDAEPEFEPANAVERDLYDAADGGSTDAFLSTLLLAMVLVPVADSSRPGSAPGEPGFAFRTEELDGEQFLVVFTSRDRLAEHYAEPTRTVGVKFLDLIRNWPDPAWSFAVNPSTPVGAKYPGAQVIALANWAAEAGLGAEPEERDDRPAPLPKPVSDAAQHATVMQKTVPAEQVDYYLERGYDRVAGFVHRANEVNHLHTPAELFAALGLVHDGTPYQADAKEAFVLRWPAYRPSLYRIPYGGQSEQALRAMDGWVIERPPFRGNGFAPGEGRDVIAEFKVDSVRLPHGAQLWRMDADGTEKMIAIFDCDVPAWRKVGEQ